MRAFFRGEPARFRRQIGQRVEPFDEVRRHTFGRRAARQKCRKRADFAIGDLLQGRRRAHDFGARFQGDIAQRSQPFFGRARDVNRPQQVTVDDAVPGRDLSFQSVCPVNRRLERTARAAFANHFRQLIRRCAGRAQTPDQVGQIAGRGRQNLFEYSNVFFGSQWQRQTVALQNREGVVQAVQRGIGENRFAQRRVRAAVPRPQTNQQVAAIDSGNVARLQWPRRGRVVPVEKMAVVRFHLRQGIESRFAAVNDLVERKITEVARRQSAQQPQADIGRAGARRDFDIEIFLIVVGRQPVGLRPDKIIEITPGLPRQMTQINAFFACQILRDGAVASARKPAHDKWRNRPQQQQRRGPPQRRFLRQVFNVSVKSGQPFFRIVFRIETAIRIRHRVLDLLKTRRWS